jgi:endonuclease-3
VSERLHADRRGRVLDALRLMQATWPEPVRPPREPAFEAIVRILLAQRSSKANRDQAWHRLRRLVPDWPLLAIVPEDELVEAVRPAGLARQRAPRLQALAREVLEMPGELGMPWVDELPLAEARSRLAALPGVGPLTAALVLLFARGRPALPVNGGLLRVARRSGMVPPDTSAARAHGLLQSALEDADVLDFHVHGVRLARELCRAARPRCEACPIAPRCVHAGGS